MKKINFKETLENLKEKVSEFTKDATVLDGLVFGFPVACVAIHIIDGFDMALYLAIVTTLTAYSHLRSKNEDI